MEYYETAFGHAKGWFLLRSVITDEEIFKISN